MLEPKNVEALRVLDNFEVVVIVFIAFFFKNSLTVLIFTALLGIIYLISSFVINHKSSFYTRLVCGCFIVGFSFMQLLKL